MLRSIIVFTERFCFYEVLVGTILNGLMPGWHSTLQWLGFEFTYPGLASAYLQYLQWEWLYIFYTTEPIPGRLNRVRCSSFPHEPCDLLGPLRQSF